MLYALVTSCWCFAAPSSLLSSYIFFHKNHAFLSRCFVFFSNILNLQVWLIFNFRSASGFIDLSKSDVSVEDLKDKFSRDTEILDTGRKSGVAVSIRSSDQTDQQIQLSALYQRDSRDKKISYTAELRRSAKKDEQKPRRVCFYRLIHWLECNNNLWLIC